MTLQILMCESVKDNYMINEGSTAAQYSAVQITSNYSFVLRFRYLCCR